MYLTKIDWATPIRAKRFLNLDIQRNNHLQAQGIPFQDYFNKMKNKKILFPKKKYMKKIQIKT
jgi:hypothetical protein